MIINWQQSWASWKKMNAETEGELEQLKEDFETMRTDIKNSQVVDSKDVVSAFTSCLGTITTLQWRDEPAAFKGGLTGTGVAAVSTLYPTAIITRKRRNQKKIHAQ